jgi:hypothetical protein
MGRYEAIAPEAPSEPRSLLAAGTKIQVSDVTYPGSVLTVVADRGNVICVRDDVFAQRFITASCIRFICVEDEAP